MKALSINNKKKTCENAVFALLMALAAGFVLWKCRYGITSVDEGLYLTIPYRLIQGDGLFVHEWHLSQMSGVLTLPLVWLYTAITGGTEGLVLFMRYCSTLVQCLVAVVLFLRLRRIHYWGALAAALCLTLYIPFGIMQLSYNSMGILFLLLCTVLLLPGRKVRRSFYVMAGLCFAAAVLCCPYLMAVYLLYLAAVAAVVLRRRMKGAEKPEALTVFGIRGALLITAGAAALAVVFGSFVLSRGSFGEILKAFRYILNDPEHPSMGVWRKLTSYARGILFATEWTLWLYAVLGALFAVCALDRKRRERRRIYFCAAGVVTAVLMGHLFYELRYINYVMWAVNMLAPFLLVLSDRDQIRRLFTYLWIPGMLYSLCIHFSSNQIFITAASASTVATVGTLVMLGAFLQELPRAGKWGSIGTTGTAVLLVLVQLSTLGYLRYRQIFWDSTGVNAQKNEITQGVQAGLLVSDERYTYYCNARQQIANVQKHDPQKVLYLSYGTWYYLEGPQEMSGYSSWLAGTGDSTKERLTAYYELNPEKLPDVIMIGNEFVEVGRHLIQTYGYQRTDVSNIWVLKK